MRHFGIIANVIFLLSIALCKAQDIQQLFVTYGDNITLPCKVSTACPVWTGPELYNGYSQEYNRDGQSSFPNPNVPEQKRTRLAWDSDKSSLIIRDVILSDKGLYQCASVAKIVLTVRGSATIQVPSAGNCNEDTVLICQVSGNIGSTRWEDFGRSIMNNGGVVRPEDQSKYTETKGTSSFTLTIHNSGINDEGDYRCSNDFDQSSYKRLNIECKASSARHKITNGKKVQITVDKLYPASPTITASFRMHSIAIQISGSQTCSSSKQYSGYYRCVWTSSNSLDDGLYTYSLVVTTITEASPLTGSFKIVSPKTPLIANLVRLNSSREVIYGKAGQSLTIQCTSNGGFPVPTLTMYKNSISNINQLVTTSSGILQSNGTYTVYLQRTFTPSLSDDMRYFICRSYYPQADNDKIGSNNRSVLLLLALKPSQPTVAQSSIVSAGNDVRVRCTTTGCRPAASISWLYQGVRYNGSTTITLNGTMETFTVISTYVRQVTAVDNGQNIKCIVTHPALLSPSEITAINQLRVNYPPKVSVNTTNTTVLAANVKLTCIAKGIPDSNYTYGKWIQRWPGYNLPVSERPGSETLELTSLTYEHSGHYTCTASNGIKVFGTNTYFVGGTPAQLLVESFPIVVNYEARIASRLNKNLTITVDYFSNVPGSDLKLYKNVNDGVKPTVIYSLTYNPVDIELPVFSHIIKTKGTRTSFNIQIKTEEDFGSYSVVISNEIGPSNKSFEVVRIEPPSTPSSFTIDYIQYNQVRLSWKRGYNGGLPQTFVIQLGTDEKTWSDFEIYDGTKQDANPITTTLTKLHDSTTYFVRLYAFNDNGNSRLSETLNFTTSPIKVKMSVENNCTSTLIVGLVQGLLNLAMIIYAVYVTILLRRRGVLKKEGGSGRKGDHMYVNMDESTNDAVKNVKKGNSRREDVANESQYTELDKKLREQDSTYDAISAM